jgi:hypothetical protein
MLFILLIASNNLFFLGLNTERALKRQMLSL